MADDVVVLTRSSLLHELHKQLLASDAPTHELPALLDSFMREQPPREGLASPLGEVGIRVREDGSAWLYADAPGFSAELKVR